MSNNMLSVIAVYLSAISFVTAILTFADKIKAKKGKWRIPENTLMLLGFIGGATVEYFTMKLIRHKTRHKKFMIGLPLFMILHILILIFVLYIKK